VNVIFNKVSFSYRKGNPVLRDFSIEIPPGITLFRGYSGCGKSTVLRLIAGFLSPCSGVVTVPPEGGCPTRSFQRKHLGFLFQDINLLPDATVSRNIELSLMLGGISRREIEVGFQQAWLKRLGLDELLHRRVKSLSGGQKQRAALARALLKNPLVLCLDEPTSGLDDENTEIVKDCLNEFRTGDRITLVATHDDRIRSIADAVIDFGVHSSPKASFS
jgi:ABC-type lipoprotein export system ATPase subunit